MWIVFGWAEWEGGEIGRLGGVMDSGVSVWMNQLCEISKYSDNLLVLTTPPSKYSDNKQITTLFNPEKQVFYRV